MSAFSPKSGHVRCEAVENWIALAEFRGTEIRTASLIKRRVPSPVGPQRGLGLSICPCLALSFLLLAFGLDRTHFPSLGNF